MKCVCRCRRPRPKSASLGYSPGVWAASALGGVCFLVLQAPEPACIPRLLDPSHLASLSPTLRTLMITLCPTNNTGSSPHCKVSGCQCPLDLNSPLAGRVTDSRVPGIQVCTSLREVGASCSCRQFLGCANPVLSVRGTDGSWSPPSWGGHVLEKTGRTTLQWISSRDKR